ncbi:MAG: DsrE/DsrF/DrsH-like family protein [Bacteroidales bacterium]|nr:DsrE/DsrF/DrsH-like family protein [Bacteroidales bacterium]
MSEISLEQRVETLEKQLRELKDQRKDCLSMVVFSNDLDKILAALIISVGAAAMDTEVRLFFTFWAISALRDKNKKIKGKDMKSRMFGSMLPHGTEQLKLSKMNMEGIGRDMIRGLMKEKNVTSPEELLSTAAELGVKINICEMSMDLMGFKKEEMIDYPDLSYCGVATFLADAGESSIQLFI